MNLIGILGLLALLGIAYAISYDRSAIRVRPILWGLGLQFLLALIVLRTDVWSFVGMALLGLLVIFYQLTPGLLEGEGEVARSIAIAATAGGVGFALSRSPANYLLVGLLATILLIAADARLRILGRRRPLGISLAIVLLVAWVVSSDLYGSEILQAASGKISALLNLSDYGARFLFGNLADPQHYGGTESWPGFGFVFACKVLPTIVFIGGLMGVLYYLGLVQKIIVALGRFMRWTIGTSGAETLCCSANIFIGHTEAPLLIKPFLSRLTRSELLTIMVGGFATIAGGVLAGFIAMGIPAGHLIAATAMSAPAALVIAKIIYPEREESETAGETALPELSLGENPIEAAATGITDGMKLAANVAAMLIGFIALVAVADLTLNFFDGWIDGRLLGGEIVNYSAGGMSPVTSEHSGFFPGSLQTLFGSVLAPLAWLMGVPWAEAGQVGALLGVKISLNELVAYGSLASQIREGTLSEEAITISTYALCGFSNFSALGIQLGGISALAPDRSTDLAELGLKAMVGGALASWMTATVAGLLI